MKAKKSETSKELEGNFVRTVCTVRSNLVVTEHICKYFSTPVTIFWLLQLTFSLCWACLFSTAASSLSIPLYTACCVKLTNSNMSRDTTSSESLQCKLRLPAISWSVVLSHAWASVLWDSDEIGVPGFLCWLFYSSW